MSSAPDRAFLCACFLLLCLFCNQPSHAVQNQTDAKAAASSIPGAFVIKPQFERAGQFSEGLAAVEVSEAEGWKWGYIDK
ncbi:MAG: WG repeat-containing protein, partial [Terracidiphilus sp.]